MIYLFWTYQLVPNSLYFLQNNLIKILDLTMLYNEFMNNLKEENIRRAIWHIKRHLDGLLNSKNEEDREYCTFHLQSSIECLERVMNNKKTYLYLDREDVF
jgi:hypothetical protein